MIQKDWQTAEPDHPNGAYLHDVASSTPLSRSEERRLALLAQRGDLDARNALVAANLRFVISVALQYQNQGLPLDDLIAHGNVGLIRAAEKFDPELGNKFITYAVWWIRQAIQSALENATRTIRIPMNRAVLAKRARTHMNEVYQTDERFPEMSDAAADLDVSEHFLQETLRLASRTLSLDATVCPDADAQTLIDTIPDDSATSAEDAYDRRALAAEIDEMLEALSDREEDVIRQYFGLHDGVEETLEGIGEGLGVSRERARQIKESALGKLRRRSVRSKARSMLTDLC